VCGSTEEPRRATDRLREQIAHDPESRPPARADRARPRIPTARASASRTTPNPDRPREQIAHDPNPDRPRERIAHDPNPDRPRERIAHDIDESRTTRIIASGIRLARNAPPDRRTAAPPHRRTDERTAPPRRSAPPRRIKSSGRWPARANTTSRNAGEIRC
jgi:hypothetical protein